MQPIDFRNATFAELRGQLVKKREAVWLDWQAYEIRHGTAGATTRQVCLWAGRDILQFRPRCTELFQMGVLKLAEEQMRKETVPNAAGHIVAIVRFGNQTGTREGLYVLRSMPEWETWCAEQRAHATSGQQQLL